jgi:hypothetical protein
MRVAVWCLACAFIACGKSERHGAVVRHGGAGNAASGVGNGGSAAATSGAGHGASGSEIGGAPASETAGTGGVSVNAGGGGDAGGRQASGGAGTSAVSGGGAGGVGASADEGGSSGETETSDGGAAGAAPATCAGEYDACGCGCCGGTTPKPVCYYPDRGESLAAIEHEDQSAAMSPSCANAGCAVALHYTCCALPSDPPPAMSYAVTGGMITPDIYRVSLYRTGTDERCQVAHFARGDGPGGKSFPITMPDGWILELLEDYLCADASSQIPSKRREAVGATGQLGFSSTSGECSVKFDFTAFFTSESGGVDAVQFASDWQEAPVVPECG